MWAGRLRMEWAEWVPFGGCACGTWIVLCFACGLCWPGWSAVVQKDQMKSGQDELSS